MRALVGAANVTAHLDLIVRPALGYAAKVGRAELKKSAPELMATFERLSKDNKPIAYESLAKAYAEEAQGRLEVLTDRAFTPAEVEALPPLLRAAYERAVRSAIYASRSARALRDPFPDGVVSQEFVFRRHLTFIDMQAAERMIQADGKDLGDVLKRIIGQGAKRAKVVDGLKVSVEKSPKGKGRQPVHGLEEGPYLVVASKDHTIYARYDRALERIEIRARANDSNYTFSALTYEPRSIFERLGDRFPIADRLPKSDDERVFGRFQEGGADLDSLALVARAVRPRPAEVTQALLEARRLKSEVLGQLAVRANWVENIREMAALVKAHGPQSLGDADHTLRIADRMERTFNDDQDRERTEIVLQGHGPLFIVEQHAGEVSHAVSLDALAQGELKMWIVRDDHPPLPFQVDAQGRVQDLEANYLYAGISAVALDLEVLPDRLKEKLVE